MKTLRRYNLKNSFYFITIVTFNRDEIILTNPDLIWESWVLPEPLAWVLLPDHLHFLFEIADQNISDVIHNFKIRFSRKYRDIYRSGRVWQNRFWDHIIRDNDDMKHHFDYIHYNPVKHDYVGRPGDWEWSSFNKYLTEGYYTEDWSVVDERAFEGSFGE